MTNDDGAPSAAREPRDAEASPLIVEVAGYEGPLDLLLAMARTQKVDLAKVSMLELAEQYLSFIENAKALRLEMAADYLVMAAWLAYLKSRLLLPREETPGVETENADDMARRLAFRLMRLDAMRNAAAKLMGRKRFGVDLFGRGQPEGVKTIRQTEHTAQIYDLLSSYADLRRRTAHATHVVKARRVWSIKEARERLERLVGETAGNWLPLDAFFERYMPLLDDGRTVLASAFGACLELARDGAVELRQDRAFGPLFVKSRDGGDWEKIG